MRMAEVQFGGIMREGPRLTTYREPRSATMCCGARRILHRGSKCG